MECHVASPSRQPIPEITQGHLETLHPWVSLYTATEP